MVAVLERESAVGSTPTTPRAAPWWRSGVVYHVYVRSFADASGDGVGDLRGLIERLDHLNDGTPRSLGVEAIWLSPIHPSPNRDAGYDVADYTAIDPAVGTFEDFDELVAECRRRGIRVVLDLVLNHTSDLHPWFEASRAGRGSDKRDWYIWRDLGPGGRPPNNWRSFFGGSAWQYDDESGQCYLHTFLPEQPDLNWQNPEVRQAALEIVRFWLERGVSGFRLDVFNAYFKHPDLPSNPRRFGRTPWARQRHVYNKDRPELHDFLLELRALLDAHDAIAIGETFDGDPELAASYCGEKLHMAFNFDVLAQRWNAAGLQAAIHRWDRLLAHERLWPSYVLSNHDHPRHARRYGSTLEPAEADARAKVAAALLLTLRGTPFVYYGEELGMHGADLTPAQRWDAAGHGVDRDTARTPMQWSAAPHAAFTSGTPWLPVARDHRERNVAAQDADARSILAFYRQLLSLRRTSPALQHGTWTPLLDAPRDVLAYLRVAPEQRMLVLLNLSDAPTRVRFPAPLPVRHWTPRVSTSRPDIGWTLPLGREVLLRPYEATVFEAA